MKHSRTSYIIALLVLICSVLQFNNAGITATATAAEKGIHRTEYAAVCATPVSHAVQHETNFSVVSINTVTTAQNQTVLFAEALRSVNRNAAQFFSQYLFFHQYKIGRSWQRAVIFPFHYFW